jgi:predicted  nucleic acid-binding Zn-ribbon protein
MKTTKTLTKSQIALALTLLALRPAFGAETTPPSPATVHAEAKADKAESKTDAYKTNLDTINAKIEAIEASLDDAPDSAAKTAAEARLETLKERRSELRKDYVKAKADELVADLKVEYAQVSDWTKHTYHKVKDKVSDDDNKPGVIPTAQAAVNSKANAALADIQLYRMNPTAENKADVKNALKALDKEIDRLEDAADDLPKGEKRTALQQRVKALEKRESELSHDFTKARWDALVNDLRDSWQSITD